MLADSERENWNLNQRKNKDAEDVSNVDVKDGGIQGVFWFVLTKMMENYFSWIKFINILHILKHT